MSHYIDIHLRPDPEFLVHQLMAALFAKLHRVLAQMQSDAIAVSFPEYKTTPATFGSTLRILGPEDDLVRTMERDWLNGMRDHIDVMRISLVPVNAVPRNLRRVQAKSSAERLRRRQMRRHGLTEEKARDRVPDSATEFLDLPFVVMASASTGQKFRLYLSLGPPLASSQSGSFNSYGLSTTASIPWF